MAAQTVSLVPTPLPAPLFRPTPEGSPGLRHVFGLIRFVAEVKRMAASDLSGLERLKANYGDGASAAKLELLRRLDRTRLRSASQVMRLHEVLGQVPGASV